jgi:hypothetical protein
MSALRAHWPVAPLTRFCCRWFNNEQALEDSANFMRNVKFQGIDEDLTAPNTPWIYYGVRVDLSLVSLLIHLRRLQGSYAGARAAHMRVLYPDIVFGAIGSSGTCHHYSHLHTWSQTERSTLLGSQR